MKRTKMTFLMTFFIFTSFSAIAQRWMENLDRGVVAIRTDASKALVSWRLFGTESNDQAFNLYKVFGETDTTKLNSSPITTSTNYLDDQVDFSKSNDYFVTLANTSSEGSPSKSFRIPANAPLNEFPHLLIELEPITSNPADYAVNFVWIGDLNGDGAFDYVVDRIPFADGPSPKLDAYLNDGTFLWRMDTGPNGQNRNNIEGGASTISNGHWDGLTVYDIDLDGQSEVIIKTARNFVFGDGTKQEADSNEDQFVTVCNGMSGAPESSVLMPQDYREHGPLQSHFGIAYLDGVNPSVIVKSKNRRDDRAFMKVVAAYNMVEEQITEQWKVLTSQYSDFHQIRTFDVDKDGKDEVCDGAYVIDDNGEILYAVGGAIHGDRFHISDMDPDRPGLEGFAIQQDNWSSLATYYYDAATGEIIKDYYTPEPADMGRGNMGDYYPNSRGFEYWSFNGMYTVQSNAQLSADVPWPNFRIWWDGDLQSELLDEWKVDDLNGGGRLLTGWKAGATPAERGAPMFYGDIMGDWREEIIFENSSRTHLVIFCTPFLTNEKIYTLAHNPAYRNSFTYKGYLQSNHVDFYLGTGMDTPPAPDIKLVGGYGKLFFIDSISVWLEGDIPGEKYAHAKVWVRGDGGPYLPNATIDGYFSGAFDENVSGLTNEDGTIEFRSAVPSGNAKVEFEFCVWSLDHDQLQPDMTKLVDLCREFEEDVILNANEQGQMLLYPNPTDGLIQIKNSHFDPGMKIQILDLNGKVVMKKKLDKNVIDLSSLSDGIYQILIAGEEYKIKLAR